MSKRTQKEAFSAKRPISTADSLFSSPALVRAASRAQGAASPSLSQRSNTPSAASSFQYGSGTPPPSQFPAYDTGYNDPYATNVDLSYDGFGTYDGTIMANDMSDFDDILNLTGPNRLRAPSEPPRSQPQTSFLPTDTMSPFEMHKSPPPTSSPIHLLSPAITGSPSPKLTIPGTRAPAGGRSFQPVQNFASVFGPPPIPAEQHQHMQHDLAGGSTPYQSIDETASLADTQGLEPPPLRKGLGPGDRVPLNEADIPSLEEQTSRRKVDATKAHVEEWLDHTTTKPPKHTPTSSSLGGHDMQRVQSHHDEHGNLVEETEEDDSDDDSDEWLKRTSIADDSPPTPRASHDHVLQTMAEATKPGDDPTSLAAGFRTLHLWSDNPDDDAASVKQTPESSTRAIERFARRAREVDTASVATTYAPSRRFSQDTTSLYSTTGISQRHPSIVEPPIYEDHEPEPRKDSLFSKLSRTLSRQHNRRESQETQKRPSVDSNKSDSQGTIPTLTRTPSASQTGQTIQHDSSSRPGFGGFLLRARSRSDVTVTGERRNSALAQQWAASGGPPVAFVRPNLDIPDAESRIANYQFPVAKESLVKADPLRLDTQRPAQIGHLVDEDEDEPVTPTRTADGQLTVPLSATLQGFRDHAKTISPNVAPFLLERIAQEQVKRYRILMELRIEHQTHVINNTCGSGQRCADLGTGPKYLRPPKVKGNKEEKSAIFQISSDTAVEDIEHLDEGETPQPAGFPEGIPLPPVKQLPAEFECPICFKVKRLQKPSDWSKHCFEDLYPFICSFADCSSEPMSFNRKADWSRHENEKHLKLETWTCNFNNCTHVCTRHDNFIQHLSRAHKMQEVKVHGARRRTAEDDSEVSKLARQCHQETTARPEDQKCPFCGNFCNSWKKLAVHLANHMKQVNLPLLTLVERENVANYLQPVNGTGVDTEALMEWRMQAAAGQNCVPSLAPSVPDSAYYSSMSPQPPPPPSIVNAPSSGVIYDTNGQPLVHPALMQGNHTFPGTKNLPRQQTPWDGSITSTPSFGNPGLATGLDATQSRYLDAIEETRSANRTPTLSTYPGPYTPSPANGHGDLFRKQQNTYPTSSPYGDYNDLYTTTSPTYEQVPPTSMPFSSNAPPPFYAQSPASTATDTNGFLPPQSQAARNAALNAQLLAQQSADTAYLMNRQNGQNMQSVYFDAYDASLGGDFQDPNSNQGYDAALNNGTYDAAQLDTAPYDGDELARYNTVVHTTSAPQYAAGQDYGGYTG